MNTNGKLLTKELNCDFCVVGGGLAGTFAAIAAARRNLKVVLIGDRPVLGGNASSEIRMWVRGAENFYDKESGLIKEFEERIIKYNDELCPSVTDAVLYDMVFAEKNIELFLNASVMDADTDLMEDLTDGKDRIIKSVTAWQLTTYTFIKVNAAVFADCSGDSILADLTGAEYMKGREPREEYGESLAAAEKEDKTMGLSIILAAREKNKKSDFIPMKFMNKYESDEAFCGTKAAKNTNFDGKYALKRWHNIKNDDNLWWIELGGDLGSVRDADKTGKELYSAVYGVWDHLKNHSDHGMENFCLDWVGALAGKRESLRYKGDYVLTENDILSGGNFYDEIAYGGWPIDDHNPAGMKNGGEAPSHSIKLDSVYGIPYRCVYSVNIKNLLFAGRNISVTHVALSSTRVMATCSLLGQAVGEAAAMSVERKVFPRETELFIKELQARIQDGGVFLPHVKRRQGTISLFANTNLTYEEKKVLFNGIERPRSRYGENDIELPLSNSVKFTFETPQKIKNMRIAFDCGWDREWLPEGKLRIFCMKLHRFLSDEPVKVSPHILKGFSVFADGELIYKTSDNFLSLVKIPIEKTVTEIEFLPEKIENGRSFRLFSIDFE